MSVLLAIDPGPETSAWLMYDLDTGRPVEWQKDCPNRVLLGLVAGPCASLLTVEKVESFGMAVGAEVFETVYWTGRFVERWAGIWTPREPIRVGRREIKLHLCGTARAKDANVRQALIDRYGGKDTAIGRKASPGPLLGLSSHSWAALALAVTVADTELADARRAA